MVLVQGPMQILVACKAVYLGILRADKLCILLSCGERQCGAKRKLGPHAACKIQSSVKFSQQDVCLGSTRFYK